MTLPRSDSAAESDYYSSRAACKYYICYYIYGIYNRRMASNAKLLLQQLHKRPIVRGDEPGQVITIKRSLPASATSRPSADKLRGVIGRRRPPSAQPSQAYSGEPGPAKIQAIKASFTDSRHIGNIDREQMLAKTKGLRIVPELPVGFASTERLDFSINIDDEFRDRALEIAPEPEADLDILAEGVEAPQAVKLSQRAVLDTSTKSPRKGPTAAAAAAAAAIEEMEAIEALDMPAAAATQKLVTRRRKPKVPKEPIISVSAAAAAATEQVTKIAKKTKDDAAQDDKFVLSTAIKIGDEIISQRLPQKREPPQIRASDFYMNNRAKFIQYINALFHNYREELTSGESDISCEALYGGDDSASVSLLTHQKIVRDYLNIFSPYRGLLLFHGLGSGKTCSSIAIAEGLKTFKKIIVMTPASLRMNYMEEMKSKCGDLMYKKNQFWEFINSRGNTELTDTLSAILGVNKSFIVKQGGAWLVNVKKPSNYETELTTGERVMVDKQINEMIREKYEFVNYNGLRSEYIKKWSVDYTQNPFDNKVVVIDEAHNFVSRIVNKLKRPTTMAYRLYDFLLSAQNAKVILLTGTPIINYPNEIAVLFNILRGNIDNWVFTINEAANAPGAPAKINLDTFKDVFGLTAGVGAGAGSGSGARKGAMASSVAARGNFARGVGLSFDNMEYNARTKKLLITRNPFGFVRDYDPVSAKYKGVIRRGDPTAETGSGSDSGSGSGSAAGELALAIPDTTATENGVLSDAAFEQAIVRKLRDNGIQVISASSNKQPPYNALPSNKDEFNSFFIDPVTLELKNRDLFIRRILGLTSYFRSAQEKLLPTYDPEMNFHVIEAEMSDYQFGIYSRIRDIERNQESQKKKNAKRGGPAKGKKAGAEGAAGAGAGVDTLYEDVSSTYRIFSRAFCNFVFPKGIHRPLPGDTEIATDAISKAAELGGDVEQVEDLAERVSRVFTKGVGAGAGATAGPAKRGRKPKSAAAGAGAAEGAAGDEGAEPEEIDENMIDGVEIDEDNEEIIITGEVSDEAPIARLAEDADAPSSEKVSKKAYVLQYQAAISSAMHNLELHASEYLTPDKLATYSPKFLHMLQNILSTEEDERRTGLHLIYSQFRTLEGIGILKLILEANGFSHFKIKQSTFGNWTLDMTPEERARPCFALYTGTESPEEKEIVRNIFNSKWKNVPKSILDVITPSYSNNMSGQVIKILMITASGAEGINLRNVRYVHITEPYWHPVRTEQIIGRARRICSHIDLPEDLRTVDVFLYVSRFSGRQIAADNDDSLNIRMNDRSKTDNVTPMTTDQSLFEISNIKARITKQILTAVKESSFDCMIHANPDSKERLNCYNFGPDANEESLAYKPDIKTEDDDASSRLNKKVVKTILKDLTISGKQYAFDPASKIIYDFEQYKMNNLVKLGKLLEIPANPKTGEPAKYNFIPDY